jgi:hypothetical protein
VQAGTTQTHGDQSVQVYYNTTGANKTLTFTGLSGAISFFQFEIIHGGIPAGFASRVDTSGGYNIVTPQIQVPYGSWAFAVMTCDDSSYAPGPIGWTWYLNNATSGKNALLAAKSCAKATTAVCARTVPSGGAGVTNNNGTIFYVPAVG